MRQKSLLGFQLRIRAVRHMHTTTAFLSVSHTHSFHLSQPLNTPLLVRVKEKKSLKTKKSFKPASIYLKQ